ncbi:MAG: UvrD-helicase domain-containing protein [Clostridiales bacterium]|nr:UvrD-helicase domain-containing protein [Clostridiales bacterium]
MRLTKEQEKIVLAPSGNILVSAAAGSGKTSVMTERIVTRILDGELSVDRVLVMTFTNAAAANMSAKLEKKLRERLALEKDALKRKNISEQITKLPMAYISTINAFCNRVISSFSAQGAGEDGEPLLEPGSSILDETHAKKLLRDAFNDAFSQAYVFCMDVNEGRIDPSEVMQGVDSGEWPAAIGSDPVTAEKWCDSFLSMVEAFGSGRDDTMLKEDMENKLSYLRSLPDYRAWIEKQVLNKQKEAGHFSEGKICAQARESLYLNIRERLDQIRELSVRAEDLVFLKDKKKNQEKKDCFARWFLYVIETGEKILSDENLSWDEIVELGKHHPDEELPSLRKSNDEDVQEFSKDLTSFYELVYQICGVSKNASAEDELIRSCRYFFGKTEQELNEESVDMAPLFARYFELVLQADLIYALKKRQESALDFQDQEQMALKLLNVEAVAGYYRDLFDEIYIDEYQDNSGVQDAIVQCFARDNVFFVGDVKQSIYRFRHAKPQMFLDRYARYKDGKEGTLFELNSNFRSVPSILAVVNQIFRAIMSSDYADIEYDDSHCLNVPKNDDGSLLLDYAQTGGAGVTLIISEDDRAENALGSEEGKEPSGNQEESADEEKIACEAMVVAGKIRELSELPGFSYSQCVVLTTSNQNAMDVAETLNRCGIPAQGPFLGNVLQHPDLRVILDLARIVDNSLQDIPLASVMKSGIRQAGFTDQQLLDIHLFAASSGKAKIPFCEKVMYMAKYGESKLAFRVRDFLAFVNDLRTLSMQMNVTKWMEHVYSITEYPERVRREKNGSARYYALMTLVTWASQFDTTRKPGLRAFVEYIEEVDSQKNAVTEIELSEPLENVVRCMTIHKSKGLEFPFVFLCGIQSGNREESTALILNENGTMAAKRYCPQWGSVYEPHDYYVLKNENRRELEAEKIRLLYVALTRAEKKLFIVVTAKRTKDGSISESKMLEDACRISSEKYPTYFMRNLNTPLKKFLAGVVRDSSCPIGKAATSPEPIVYGDVAFSDPVRSAESEDMALISDKGKNLSVYPQVNSSSASDAYEAARKENTGDCLSEEEKERVGLLSRDIHEWAEMTLVPAKTTVSEMKRSLAAQEDPDLKEDEDVTVRAINMRLHESGQKWTDGGYSATQLGTLIHSAWQYIDFSGLLSSGQNVEWETVLKTLCEHDMITEEQIRHLRPFTGCMQQFLESELCRRMVMAEGEPEHGPYREIPFALAVPNGQDDFSLVQGMIDCWFVDTDGQAVLIDYKSDRIEGTMEEKQAVLEERYGFQLDMYAKAIVSATGKQVKEKIIWLIRDGISFVL